jgi:hypothetical protein
MGHGRLWDIMMVYCARIDHTIRLVIQGLRALAQAQEAVRQAAILREKAEASMVRRQDDRTSK